jgi:DNA-binding CsgD family transcriptional regulator
MTADATACGAISLPIPAGRPAHDLLPTLAQYADPLLDSVTKLVSAPLLQIAECLRDVISPYIKCSALVIFTEDCTGRPRKKAGDNHVTDRVSIEELDRLRKSLPSQSPWQGKAQIADEPRQVLAVRSETNSLLVLTDPQPVPPKLADSLAAQSIVLRLWHVTAACIREKVTEATPSYLLESRAVSAERLRITAELTDQHSTTLETLLAALRSPAQDDRAVRMAVTDLAASALVRLRTSSDRAAALVEEPVANAFERLRDDLRPLTRFSRIDFQFVEPPADGRALPGEVAHAARAVVRGIVLVMADQPTVRRVRIQWNCDGDSLLINVRDDGSGELSVEADNFKRLTQRVEALKGSMTTELMAGWGADVSIALPLDHPDLPLGESKMGKLAPREFEVLELLAQGKRNRSIATELQISENTVKFHLRSIFRKLHVASRTEAIALAHQRRM